MAGFFVYLGLPPLHSFQQCSGAGGAFEVGAAVIEDREWVDVFGEFADGE